MKFQTGGRYKQYKITVRAANKPNELGIAQPGRAGVYAEFRSNIAGQPAFLDTEVAQRQHRWSDELRDEVERSVLSHKKFGHGIYLAHGEKIPGRHKDLAPTDSKVAEVTAPSPRKGERCANFETVEGGAMEQCPNFAVSGSDLCPKHQSESSEDLTKPEEPEEQCRAQTAAGSQCSRKAVENGLCSQHQDAEVLA